MGDHVNPESGRIALGKAAVKEFDLFGNVGEDRVEPLVEHFEARERRIAQVNDAAGPSRKLDAGLPHGLIETHRPPQPLFETALGHRSPLPP
jgi:hypothetical protein